MNKVLPSSRQGQWVMVFVCAVTLLAGGAWLTQAPAQTAEREAIDYAKGLSRVFRAAANDVLPSVVTIIKRPEDVVADGQPSERRQPDSEVNPFEGTPFEEFFRDTPGLRERFRGFPTPRAQPSVGSGVIIDSSGLILTNNHVVEGGGEVIVRLHNGDEFVAEDVRTDPRTDVAIVRISGSEDLKAANIGDSNTLEVGDWVLAAGNPFGQEGSVTAGIISAKNRGPGIALREEFLQTDAAINPGNSGGPLINLDGEVVGINTAISTRTGTYAGVAFAIPINLAMTNANELAEYGEVRRAYLGVGIQPIDNGLARQFDLDERRGALIASVGPNTPASEAGLQPGDVIVEFDGKEIDSPQTLIAVVERTPIDSEVPVVIVRDGRRERIGVTVRKQPKNYGMDEAPAFGRRSPSQTPESGNYEELGIEVSSLTPQIAEQLGVGEAEGVVITSVRRGSPADRARPRLSSTMVITKVGQTDIRNLEDFEKAMSEVDFENDGVLFLVRRGSGSQFVVVPAPRK